MRELKLMLATLGVATMMAGGATGAVCAPGGTCPAPAPERADTFLPSGKMALGANYWASHAATEMWRKWDAKAVEEDLRVLAANGFRLLRVFPNWADFQPIHACYLSANNFDKVNETRLFDAEEPLPDTPCDLAEKYGIRLIVPLLTGQMTFRNYIPPALANRNPFSDPYALMWEGRYLECMVSRLKAKKSIVAWESGNEARILGKSENAFHSEAWLRYVHQTIRLADPSRPVIGVDGLEISRETLWPSAMNAALSDYTTTHPYGFWGAVYNDDFLSVRSTTFAAAQTYALAQIGGKPAFIEEHGSRRQEQASQANVAKYMRKMLWWCAYDQTGMTIAPYNWRQPCVELGIFRRDRTPYPAVGAAKAFAAMQDALPVAGLPKAKTEAVVLTTDRDVLHASYILARQAGIMPRFANPEEKLPEASCYFLPDAHGRAYLTVERWEDLKARVRAGATLYLSWNDTFLDAMEEVGGIEVAYRQRTGGQDVCDFGDFKLPVGYAVKRRFNALTAETLARNQAGEGVFFRNRYGKGTVYVFIHNFEKTSYGASGKYEGDAWRVWAKVRPVNRILKTGVANVFVSEHCFGGGRCGVVVVNNRDVPYEGTPEIWKNWRVRRVVVEDPANASFIDGKLKIAPCAGVLLFMAKDGVDWL